MTNLISKKMTRNRVARRWMIVAMMSALCAVFAGLAITPAHADPVEWTVYGTFRTTLDQAQADVPATEAECRRQDGIVVGSAVWMAQDVGGTKVWYYAHTACMAKRDAG
jgi:hypothetical protein